MIRKFVHGDRILISARRKSRGWLSQYIHRGYEYKSGHNWASITAVTEVRWAIEGIDGQNRKDGFRTKKAAINALMSHVEYHP